MTKRLLLLLLLTNFVFNFMLGQELRKGPYLIYPGENSKMTLLWQTNSSLTSCSLSWGLTTDYSSGNITVYEDNDLVNGHQYSYTINGLEAATKYYYKLVAGDQIITSFFHSAPSDTAVSANIMAYGDTRTYPDRQNIVSQQMLNNTDISNNPYTLLIHSGDWNESDSENKWDNEFFNTAYSANMELKSKLPLMGVRGNHEGNCTYYDKYWPYDYIGGNHYYSFDYGPVHFAVIDQYVDYSANSEQLLWLEQDLSNSDKIWKIICLHEPAYTDESRHHNSIDAQESIQPLCVQQDIQLVIGGHNHYYAHCLIDGVHHLTLGGGGAPTYNAQQIGEGLLISESSLHYATISVNSGTALISIVRTDGTIIESFTLVTDVNGIPINENPDINIYTITNKIILEAINYEDANVAIYDMNGRKLYNSKVHNSKTIIDVSGFVSGIYIVEYSIGGKTYTRKQQLIK